MVPYELNIEDNVRWVFLCLLFLPSNINFLHSNVSMFLRFLFWNNRVCFVGLCCCQCCCFYIITVAINFIVIIIFICISNIIVIIIIVLTLFFVLPLFQCYCYCQYITNPYYRSRTLYDVYLERPCTLLQWNLILIIYDFQNKICTKKDCELIKAVTKIFSL